MKIIEYSSNNSGGNWWLEDKDWINLEKAGWKVIWSGLEYDYKNGNYQKGKDGFPKTVGKKNNTRWLGSLAKYAYFKSDSLENAIKNWEKITGQYSNSVGCECCGQPHNFSIINMK